MRHAANPDDRSCPKYRDAIGGSATATIRQVIPPCAHSGPGRAPRTRPAASRYAPDERTGGVTGAGPDPAARAAALRALRGVDAMQPHARPANLERIAVDEPCGPRERRARGCAVERIAHHADAVDEPVRHALCGQPHGHRDRGQNKRACHPHHRAHSAPTRAPHSRAFQPLLPTRRCAATQAAQFDARRQGTPLPRGRGPPGAGHLSQRSPVSGTADKTRACSLRAA